MDKRHKITAAVSAGALVFVLGVSGVAYSNVRKDQGSQVSAQVQAANRQTQTANKAKAVAEAQAQTQTYRLNKVYAECIVQAKKAKTTDAGAACTD